MLDSVRMASTVGRLELDVWVRCSKCQNQWSRSGYPDSCFDFNEIKSALWSSGWEEESREFDEWFCGECVAKGKANAL